MTQVRNEPKSQRLSVRSPAAEVENANSYPTQTLFQQIIEKKLPLINNIVIIGRLRDTWDKQSELADYYENYINSIPSVLEKSLDNRECHTPGGSSMPPVTGLLLIFPTLFIHSLEVTNPAMKLILEDLDQSIRNRDNGLIREASILNISYNVPARTYSNWTFKSVKLAVEDLDAQPAETIEAISLEVLGKLLRIAKYQANERRANERPVDILANVDQRADLLPNQANINYLLKQPIFQTAEDILKNYQRPINVRFESDLTAPPTHRLFPINFSL
ncbi:unnamed protein product [Adineta ricciae]|uniref:Uncharacterized protein n=1 Tax=Adineta ricciae TaxID=249248 RepID=A0A814DAE7_ADIRI|nr:unnamed protein product [Adineta ricciae]